MQCSLQEVRPGYQSHSQGDDSNAALRTLKKTVWLEIQRSHSQHREILGNALKFTYCAIQPFITWLLIYAQCRATVAIIHFRTFLLLQEGKRAHLRPYPALPRFPPSLHTNNHQFKLCPYSFTGTGYIINKCTKSMTFEGGSAG